MVLHGLPDHAVTAICTNDEVILLCLITALAVRGHNCLLQKIQAGDVGVKVEAEPAN